MAYLWAKQFFNFWLTPLLLIAFLLILVLGFYKSLTLSKRLFIFIAYLCVLILYFGFKSHPTTLDEPKPEDSLKITYIQESKSQIRFSLQTLDGNGLLGIYYKPTYINTSKQLNFIVGKVTSIKTTKTQLQLTLIVDKHKALIIIRKKNLTIPLTDIKNNIIIQAQMPDRKFLRKLDPNKKMDKKKLQQGISYIGYVKDIDIVKNRGLELSLKKIAILRADNFQVGDFIKLSTKTGWKKILPFKYPLYLFAQGITYSSNIKQIEKISLPNRLTSVEYISQKLISLYKTAQYPSFYWSVLLGKKPLDKEIYRLFQKSELVHLLVISGSHIDIIISFFMCVLTILFAIPFIIKSPHHTPSYLKELRFFSIKARSLPLFIVLSFILVFYLLLTDSQQAGARAIIGFLIAGILYQLGLKISVFILLALSIAGCFLFYPEWITYPVGLMYSSTAVLSLYLCLPIIFKSIKPIRSKILKLLVSSVLTSTLVSLFIAPLSFYFFHYYNFISIFTNIPMGILFFVFIYIASFASLLGLIAIPLGAPILRLSDYCIQTMLEFLRYTEHWSWLKVYIHGNINLTAMLLFYIAIIIGIQNIKDIFHIQEMKT